MQSEIVFQPGDLVFIVASKNHEPIAYAKSGTGSWRVNSGTPALYLNQLRIDMGFHCVLVEGVVLVVMSQFLTRDYDGSAGILAA